MWLRTKLRKAAQVVVRERCPWLKETVVQPKAESASYGFVASQIPPRNSTHLPVGPRTRRPLLHVADLAVGKGHLHVLVEINLLGAGQLRRAHWLPKARNHLIFRLAHLDLRGRRVRRRRRWRNRRHRSSRGRRCGSRLGLLLAATVPALLRILLAALVVLRHHRDQRLHRLLKVSRGRHRRALLERQLDLA